MKIIFLILLVLNLGFAQAGVKEVGNGGYAVVCRDSDKQISEAHLLDIFEKENSGTEILYSDSPVDDQIKNIIKRLDATPGIQYEVSRQMKIIKSRARYLKNSKVGMALTGDSFPRLRGKGCDYEQLATYFESTEANDYLLVDAEIYEALNPTEQAALWFHEALYKLDRNVNKAKNSLHTRDLVGMLFAASISKGIETNFNETFSIFTLVSNVAWIDPSKKINLKITTNLPVGTTCSIESIGALEIKSNLFENELGYIGESFNGFHFNSLFSECLNNIVLMNADNELNLSIDFIQEGKNVLTLKFSNFYKGMISRRSDTYNVFYPNSTGTSQELIFRFL